MGCGGCGKSECEPTWDGVPLSQSISDVMDRVLEERNETFNVNPAVDRFDLEQAIMEQTGIADDLDTLCSHILDNGIDVDKIVNILTGIAAMHRIKNDALFDVYCQVFDLEG